MCGQRFVLLAIARAISESSADPLLTAVTVRFEVGQLRRAHLATRLIRQIHPSQERFVAGVRCQILQRQFSFDVV
jgi:hypothetical protein